MNTNEALRNLHQKCGLFMKALRENFSVYDFALFILLLSMSALLLSIAYTILLNGGLEYSVRIGKP